MTNDEGYVTREIGTRVSRLSIGGLIRVDERVLTRVLISSSEAVCRRGEMAFLYTWVEMANIGLLPIPSTLRRLADSLAAIEVPEIDVLRRH